VGMVRAVGFAVGQMRSELLSVGVKRSSNVRAAGSNGPISGVMRISVSTAAFTSVLNH